MGLAQLIREMSAAGAPAEAIALAVDAIEQAQAVVEQRRAVERDRKRRQRDRKRDSHGTVTGQSGDVTDEAPLSRPPNEINSNPPTHTPPDMNTRARKGHRLPEGWQPEALTGDAAQEVAVWPPGALERELARFRDWAASATGPNAVKSNWQAAWRNWLKKAQDDGRYGRPQQRNGFSGQGSTRDLGMEVAAELRSSQGSSLTDIVPRLGSSGRAFG